VRGLISGIDGVEQVLSVIRGVVQKSRLGQSGAFVIETATQLDSRNKTNYKVESTVNPMTIAQERYNYNKIH
jgi:hypothetical protein